MNLRIETDKRVNESTGYCLHCVIHEGRESRQPLVPLTREFRQCPRCWRVYLCALSGRHEEETKTKS